MAAQPTVDDEVDVPHRIDFHITECTINKSGLIPCCIFVGQVSTRHKETKNFDSFVVLVAGPMRRDRMGDSIRSKRNPSIVFCISILWYSEKNQTVHISMLLS